MGTTGLQTDNFFLFIDHLCASKLLECRSVDFKNSLEHGRETCVARVLVSREGEVTLLGPVDIGGPD